MYTLELFYKFLYFVDSVIMFKEFDNVHFCHDMCVSTPVPYLHRVFYTNALLFIAFEYICANCSEDFIGSLEFEGSLVVVFVFHVRLIGAQAV